MNKVILSYAIWLLASPFASAQTKTIADLKPDTIKVTTGYSMNLHSDILNQDRTIMVSVLKAMLLLIRNIQWFTY